MVFRDFLLAFMSLLLTFSIILHTAFAHFLQTVRHWPWQVFFRAFRFLSLHTGYTSAIRTDRDHRLLFLSNIAFSVVHLHNQNLTVHHRKGLFAGVGENLIQHVPLPSSMKESVAIRVSTETVRKDMLIFRCKNPNKRTDMCHYTSQQREFAIIFYPSVKVCVLGSLKRTVSLTVSLRRSF